MKLLSILTLLVSPIFAAEFQLKEKAFSIGTDLEIVGTNSMIKEQISIGRSFIIDGKYACTSDEHVLTIGTTYKIESDGKTIAIIEKQVIDSLFTPFGNSFVIKDNNGNMIAKSELFRGLRPTISIIESNGVKSTLKASGIKYYTWHISQPDNSKLDPRILFIIAASKTAGDNEN